MMFESPLAIDFHVDEEDRKALVLDIWRTDSRN